MRCVQFCLLLLFVLSLPVVGQAQSNATQSPTQNPPKPVNATQIKQSEASGFPIQVIHNDTDHLGIELAYNMRDAFNRSSLFELTDSTKERIKLRITTKEEFADRPYMSSVYTLIWTFSYGEDVLDTYLDTETGFVDALSVDSLAKILVAQSHDVAREYAYLFEDD
ncbi:MAG: hypothetical protein ACQESV_09255 [Thermodesulfobacteriota bacterium]